MYQAQAPPPTQLRSGIITEKLRQGPSALIRVLWTSGRAEWIVVSEEEYARASWGAEVESGQ
jgi:hypothetical protein